MILIEISSDQINPLHWYKNLSVKWEIIRNSVHFNRLNGRSDECSHDRTHHGGKRTRGEICWHTRLTCFKVAMKRVIYSTVTGSSTVSLWLALHTRSVYDDSRISSQPYKNSQRRKVFWPPLYFSCNILCFFQYMSIIKNLWNRVSLILSCFVSFIWSILIYFLKKIVLINI